LKEGARAKEFELAIQWLTDAGLLHKVFAVTKAGTPLVSYQDFSVFKLYHNDLGLLGAMSKLKAKTIVDGDAVFEEFKSSLTEQYVFQQLLLDEELTINYFPFDNGRYELDFLIENEDGELIPIEVKAGENLDAPSFKMYCQRKSPKTAIKASLANYKKENWLTNLPLYAINTLTNEKLLRLHSAGR
jgi:hypothetical protein